MDAERLPLLSPVRCTFDGDQESSVTWDDETRPEIRPAPGMRIAFSPSEYEMDKRSRRRSGRTTDTIAAEVVNALRKRCEHDF